MADPIGAIQLGLTTTTKAWGAFQDVRGAGENMEELKSEVRSFESILKALEKDQQLNPVGAEMLEVPIQRCNQVIEDILEKLKPFSKSKLGLKQSIEAAWSKSGFDTCLITLRGGIDLLMATRNIVSNMRMDKFIVEKQQAMQNDIFRMASVKGPDGGSLIEMFLSLISRPGQDQNTALKAEIESVLQKQKSSISMPVEHRRKQGKRLNFFVCADDGRVYTARWSESDFDLTDIKTWICLPAPPGKSFPPGAPVTAISRKPNQLELFICGDDGHVFTTWWIAGYGWHYKWHDIGGDFLPGTRISAIARKPEQLDLFASAGDGNVYTCWWSKEDKLWNGPLGISLKKWKDLGGARHRKSAPAANVAALSRDPESIDIFFCDDNGQICYKNWTKETYWDKHWTMLGKSPLVPGGLVTAVSRHKGVIDLFACGTDGKVYTSWSKFSKHQWSGRTQGWKCLLGGFKPGSQVTAVARAAERLDLHVIGTGGVVYHLGWSSVDGWGSWSDIGGSLDPNGRVKCVLLDSSTLQLFLATRQGKEDEAIELTTIQGEDENHKVRFRGNEWKSLGTIIPRTTIY